MGEAGGRIYNTNVIIDWQPSSLGVMLLHGHLSGRAKYSQVIAQLLRDYFAISILLAHRQDAASHRQHFRIDAVRLRAFLADHIQI